MVLLGGMREIIGLGSLFSGIEMLLGDSALKLTINLPYEGALIAILPPGAFFGLAALIALRNLLVSKVKVKRI